MAKKKAELLEEGSRISIKPLDLAVMLWHLQLAAKDPDIGHNDADRDLKRLIEVLKPKIPSRFDTEIIESALYSCNLMDESGKFWHPEDKSFDEYLKDIAWYSREHGNYNRFYSYFEEKKNDS